MHLLTCIPLLLVFFFFAWPAAADLLLNVDYGSGNFSQGPGWAALCCNHSGRVVDAPGRPGKKAARYELHFGDPKTANGTRAERVYKGNNRIGKVGGPDEWYGFSIYLPPDYGVDSGRSWNLYSDAFEILAQWHSTPDAGEVSPSPPLSIATDGRNWRIISVSSSTQILTSNTGNFKSLWTGAWQAGTWTDWVIHVKWSYQDDGFLEIWKDGRQVVNYRGPNAYNDRGNNYFQWGIYKPLWNSGRTSLSTRVVYNGELRIGDSTSSYAEVAPQGKGGNTPTSPAQEQVFAAPTNLRVVQP